MIHVGFTGTQKGMTDNQRLVVQQLILIKAASDLHHGDCVGADDQADDLARSVQCRIHIHPPTNDKKRAFCFMEGDVIYPPRPYLERNKRIVERTGLLIATPGEFEERIHSGTWSTIRYAKRLGKPVLVVFPGGTVWCP